jgi:hypothetical protein
MAGPRNPRARLTLAPPSLCAVRHLGNPDPVERQPAPSPPPSRPSHLSRGGTRAAALLASARASRAIISQRPRRSRRQPSRQRGSVLVSQRGQPFASLDSPEPLEPSPSRRRAASSARAAPIGWSRLGPSRSCHSPHLAGSPVGLASARAAPHRLVSPLARAPHLARSPVGLASVRASRAIRPILRGTASSARAIRQPSRGGVNASGCDAGWVTSRCSFHPKSHRGQAGLTIRHGVTFPSGRSAFCQREGPRTAEQASVSAFSPGPRAARPRSRSCLPAAIWRLPSGVCR